MFPQRADLVAAVGELTGSEALRGIYNRMLHDNSGLRLLSEKPLITVTSPLLLLPIHHSSRVEPVLTWLMLQDDFLNECAQAPPGSFGMEYYDFMKRRDFRADERPLVRFVDDAELAYVATRYRQVHDFWHVLFACNTTLLGETALKALEFSQVRCNQAVVL